MADRYAYLGPEGTFTEAALAAFDPAVLTGALSCATIQATLDAVRGGEADRAIVDDGNQHKGQQARSRPSPTRHNSPIIQTCQ